MSYGPMDLLGNIGVVVMILTYLMLQLNKLSSHGLAYSMLNAIGAGLVIVSLLFKFNLSALLLEGFWGLICWSAISGSSGLKAPKPKTLDGENNREHPRRARFPYARRVAST